MARQLTSAALNCLFSNAFDGTTCVGNPGGVDFATCNAVCAGAVGNGPPNTTKTVEQCINELDCFNNGLAINPDGTCGGSTGCHTGELPLCDPKFGVNVNLPNCSGNCRFDTCKDPDTGLGRQGPAGSDDECQGINSKGGAISTPCTVVGATEGCCCKDSCGSLPATPNSCKNYVTNNCK